MPGTSKFDAQAAVRFAGAQLKESCRVKQRISRSLLAALALTTNSSILTAVGNDYGFADIFARQVEGLVETGDLGVGITTSGVDSEVWFSVSHHFHCRWSNA